jgi:hypothetical protein
VIAGLDPIEAMVVVFCIICVSLVATSGTSWVHFQCLWSAYWGWASNAGNI